MMVTTSLSRLGCGFPGSFGFGSAIEAVAEQFGQSALVDMLAGWRFFRCLVNDVEMVLAKSDLDITQRYAALADDDAGDLLFKCLAGLPEFGNGVDVRLRHGSIP